MSITEAGSTLAPSTPHARQLWRTKVATALARLCRSWEVRIVAEGFTGLTKLQLARAGWLNLIMSPSKGITWRRLSTEAANPVKSARNFTARRLRHVAITDAEHVDDVILAASELVTNAIQHTTTKGPFWIGLAVQPRWTHLYVLDTDHTVPKPAPSDELALSGRGLPIVEQLGLLWFVAGVYGKTAHAVITRTGEQLTDAEHRALMRLTIV